MLKEANGFREMTASCSEEQNATVVRHIQLTLFKVDELDRGKGADGSKDFDIRKYSKQFHVENRYATTSPRTI